MPRVPLMQGSPARRADDRAARERARAQRAANQPQGGSAYERLLNQVKPTSEKKYGPDYKGYSSKKSEARKKDDAAARARAREQQRKANQKAREQAYEQSQENRENKEQQSQQAYDQNGQPIPLLRRGALKNTGQLFAGPMFTSAPNSVLMSAAMQQPQQTETQSSDPIGDMVASLFGVQKAYADEAQPQQQESQEQESPLANGVENMTEEQYRSMLPEWSQNNDLSAPDTILNQESGNQPALSAQDQEARDYIENLYKTYDPATAGQMANTYAMQLGMQSLGDALTSNTDAGAVMDAIDAQSQEEVPAQTEIKDTEGNKLDIRDDNQLEITNALLQEAGYDPYESLTEFQVNGDRDQWHTVMLDPRTVGQFQNSLAGYIEDEAQRQQFLDGVSNIANDQAVRDLAEQAFNTLWDTQKQWNVDRLIAQGNAEDLDRYNKVFSANSVDDLASWAASHNLNPALALRGDDGELYAMPMGINDLYDPTTHSQITTDDSLYDDAIASLFGRYAAMTDDEATSALDENELNQLNTDLNRYILLVRELNGANAQDRIGQVNQDWVNEMLALDPSGYYTPEFLESSEGQEWKNQDLAGWNIGGAEGAGSFGGQNDRYGQNDYTPEGAVGDYYADMDALLQYGIPMAGIDQLLANYGFTKGYRADDIRRSMEEAGQ